MHITLKAGVSDIVNFGVYAGTNEKQNICHQVA